MTDGSFSFKPMLKQADLQYINKLASKNEVLSVRGLDHTEALKGYRTSTLEFGNVLAISFQRWNDASNNPTVVFLFRRAGQNWKWAEGLEYDPPPDPIFWDPANHYPLCNACNAYQCVMEEGGFGTPKRIKGE